jgi:hypothetical protein
LFGQREPTTRRFSPLRGGAGMRVFSDIKKRELKTASR